jgi:hypothetical protein
MPRPYLDVGLENVLVALACQQILTAVHVYLCGFLIEHNSTGSPAD